MDTKDALWKKKLLPQYQLDQPVLEATRKTREPYLAARAEALKAIPLKTGWYPRNLSFDRPVVGLIPNHVSEVGRFLLGLAMLESQDVKHDDAWQTSLAILATGRSFGDEPGLMILSQRRGLQAMAANSFERCLAQGTMADPILAQAMKSLADEAAVPLFYDALRGERAWADEYLTRLDGGNTELQKASLDKMVGSWRHRRWRPRENPTSF